MGMVEQSKSDATIAWDESQSMVNALPAVVPHATGLHHYVEARGGGLVIFPMGSAPRHRASDNHSLRASASALA